MALRPLIAVCGSTGVGKSKFAVELAHKLFRGSTGHGWQGARIINADCMQVYAGMDVVTNKVPKAEMEGIDHLLMGFKKPGEQYFVNQWVQDAMAAIDETHSRNQIPIVAGGTIYWIQRLMFADRLASSETSPPSQALLPDYSTSNPLTQSLSSLSPQLLSLYNNLPDYAELSSAGPQDALRLHALLYALDPTVASRWHWKDMRKVLRSIRYIRDTGRMLSETLTQQSQIDVTPRYRTLCFWLYAKPSVLRARLDERVDEMLEQGLSDEIDALRDIETSSTAHTDAVSPQSDLPMTDFTSGIYDTIGYKEFREYLASPERSEDSFNDAVQVMKQSTRRYARGQVTWLRNKFLPVVHAANSDGLVTPTYLLDASERARWKTNVQDVGLQIAEDFLAERDLPDPKTLSDSAHEMFTIGDKPIDGTAILKARRRITCSVCSNHSGKPVTLEDGTEWELHQNSRRHKRLVARANQVEPAPEPL